MIWAILLPITFGGAIINFIFFSLNDIKITAKDVIICLLPIVNIYTIIRYEMVTGIIYGRNKPTSFFFGNKKHDEK